MIGNQEERGQQWRREDKKQAFSQMSDLRTPRAPLEMQMGLWKQEGLFAEKEENNKR